jgi:hypothetical protein
MSNTLARLRAKALVTQQDRCFYCQYTLCSTGPDAFARQHGITIRQARLLICTAEHLTARQDGGRDRQTNIAAACSYCNQHRHRLKKPPDPDRFAQYVRRRVSKRAWHSHALQKPTLRPPAALH